MKKEKIYLDFVGLEGYIFRGDNGEDIASVWKDRICATKHQWKVKLKPGIEDFTRTKDASFRRIADVKNYLRLVGNRMERYEW